MRAIVIVRTPSWLATSSLDRIAYVARTALDVRFPFGYRAVVEVLFLLRRRSVVANLVQAPLRFGLRSGLLLLLSLPFLRTLI